ncbi:MAG: serine hydrolase [Ignavibacteriales bacterium]|nr:serine hydrolase [Ignavibacteriales bacterium]
MKKYIYVFFILFVISSTVLLAQTTAEKIDHLIFQYNENRLFNGSALVSDNFETIFKNGYGLANMEWNLPNTPDTKFRLGSVTKQFTSMLIMQLVEKGKIKLDGKITDYLPYYRKDTGDKITIELLLTHSSGIPSYTSHEDFGEKVSRKFYKPDDFVKEYCSGDLEFEPGSQFLYNNSGYFILGAIIEKVTGITYEEALKKNILEPLGMKDTGYDWSEAIVSKRAAGYDKTFSDYKNTSYVDMSLPYSAGSLYSTVEDLLIWDKALQTDKLLSNKWKEELFKPRADAFGGKYAFGWILQKKKIGSEEFDVITHGGSINGFNTINYIIPKKGQAVILFSNASAAPLNEMTDKIIGILNGEEVKPPLKSLANYLHGIINEDGIDAAIEKFDELKNEIDVFSLRENEMNMLGYEMLAENRFDEALGVFKLNVREYPKSYNVYDSYGEALLKKGIKDSAIVYYKKSLEFNPRSKNGIKVLKELGIEIEEPKDADVPAEILQSYTGKYQLAPNFVMTITINDKQIFAQATGQPQIEIFPESQTKFYVKVVEAKIEFVKENGKVSKLILYQNGREMPAPKIE